MFTLIVLGVFGIVQAILYWLCIRRQWNYIDFVVFGFSVLSNCWLIPKWLMEPVIPEGECGFSYNGMTMFFCLTFGNVISVVLFLVYLAMRREKERKKAESASSR